MDQKVKDLVKWKNYYSTNKTKYLIQRLQKRMLKGCNVKYITPLKYDMVGYYLQNANVQQLKVFEEQKKFYDTMNDVTNLKGHEQIHKLLQSNRSVSCDRVKKNVPNPNAKMKITPTMSMLLVLSVVLC